MQQLSEPLPSDRMPIQVTQWEDIALKEYMLDGDRGGWESENEEDQETAEEKCIRENPGVPVISNLEDLYKLPRLQKVQQEENRKRKMAKLRTLRKHLEAEEAAHVVTVKPSSREHNSLPSNEVESPFIVDLD